MNILFISISAMPHLSKHSISLDLIHELKRRGHDVSVVCAMERKEKKGTTLSNEAGCNILRVRIGNNKMAGVIEKGLTTLFLPWFYIRAIKKYYKDIKFDLVLYPTPPVTQVDTVKFIKKRDGAKSYLLLKDIFPQNAVDIGMMKKSGIKGILYAYFRLQEKRLYKISDRIGCMSKANVRYVLEHNKDVRADKVEICPNSIEVEYVTVTEEEKTALREKYGIPLDKKVFCYGGNLGKPQGIPFIIECLKKQMENENAYFLIVGGGTEYKKLEAFFESEKPQNMKLMSKLPKEEYDKMVAGCDYGLIFLDHRFTIPNFPSRLLSYMQAGLPVIAATDVNSDIGQVIEEGGFGFCAESNDVEAFSNAIEKALLADTKEMSEKAKKYLMDNYSVTDACDTILK